MKTDRTALNKGTTLIETVVAVSILMLFISGICGLALYAKQVSDRAGDQYRAVNIAKNRIERARNSDFALITGFAESNTRVNGNGSPDSDGFYRRTTVVTEDPFSAGNSNLVQVAVQVNTLNRKSLDFTGGTVSLQTYIARYMEPES